MKVYALYRVRPTGYDTILIEALGIFLDKLSAMCVADDDSKLEWKSSEEGVWVGYTSIYEVVAVIKEQDLLQSSKYSTYVPSTKTVLRECPK